MARRRLREHAIRNIQRSRRTYYVTIPENILRDLGWRERQKVVIRKLGKKRIVISDW